MSLREPTRRPLIGFERQRRGEPLRRRIALVPQRTIYRVVFAALSWMSLIIFAFFAIFFVADTSIVSFYRISLLLPHCLHTGIAVGLTLDVGTQELRVALLTGIVALITDVVLFVVEISRFVKCIDVGLVPATQLDFYICTNETTAHFFLPILTGVLILLLVVALIVLFPWIGARATFIRQRAQLMLQNTAGTSGARRSADRRSGSTSATGTPYFTFERDAQLFERTGLSTPAESQSLGTYKAIAWLLIVVLVLIGFSITVMTLVSMDGAAFYRAPFFILPLHVAGALLGAVFSTGRAELYYGIALAALATGLGVFGSVVELIRLVRCTSSTLLPITQVNTDICDNEFAQGFVLPIALVIETIVCAVTVFVLFAWSRALQNAMRALVRSADKIGSKPATERVSLATYKSAKTKASSVASNMRVLPTPGMKKDE